MEEEDWDRMMDTHVKGAFLATQACLRGMVRLKRGMILNIGSLAGVKMLQAPVHYATAKAALKGFTESLAKEVARYGIRVNCLAPGLLEEGVSDNLPAHRRAEFLQHCALGRLGTPEEVAELAAFLVSDRNTYMSGATVVVDGAV
jgi:NAD(P)-dependent dehydrogenase (short-subunit alcohol dehydrogenase family)